MRKYISEFGLDVYVSDAKIFPVEGLMQFEQDNGNEHYFHIYCILGFPQFYYKYHKCYVDDDGVHLVILEVKDGNEVEHPIPPFKIFENMKADDITLKSQYPFASLSIVLNNIAAVDKYPHLALSNEVKADDLFLYIVAKTKPICQFDVLYVGQAYGKNGERTAIERLSNHATLQKILTDCHSKYLDKRLFIMLLDFETNMNICIDWKNALSTSEEDDAHRKNVISTELENQQIINITEAALINYFKPVYNFNFVDNFPDVKHRGYRQYFDLDFNSIIVEFNIEFDIAPRIQLYTEHNQLSNTFGFFEYNLFNDPKRKNMYDIFREKAD